MSFTFLDLNQNLWGNQARGKRLGRNEAVVVEWDCSVYDMCLAFHGMNLGW
jgi:hypothetical protein